MMYLALYLMVAALGYFVMLSSPHGVFYVTRYGVYVGIFYKPNDRAWHVFLIPCIGVRFQL